jgi:hypothetical protein
MIIHCCEDTEIYIRDQQLKGLLKNGKTAVAAVTIHTFLTPLQHRHSCWQTKSLSNSHQNQLQWLHHYSASAVQ